MTEKIGETQVSNKIDTSPVSLIGADPILLRNLGEALGMYEFWGHHEQCVPLSATGCTCGIWKLREAIHRLRGQ